MHGEDWTVSDEIFEIYVALLSEDVDVWRPVKAVCISGNRYRVIEQAYDRGNETWEFPPGAEVVCEHRVLQGETALVAARGYADSNQKR